MPEIAIGESAYGKIYDSVEECVAATFSHFRSFDDYRTPPVVTINGLPFLRIPKNASQTLLALSDGVAPYNEPVYVVLRDPVERAFSAWCEKQCWRALSQRDFAGAIYRADKWNLDLHLRPQYWILAGWQVRGYVLFDNLVDELGMLGITGVPHLNPSSPVEPNYLAGEFMKWAYEADIDFYERIKAMPVEERLNIRCSG